MSRPAPPTGPDPASLVQPGEGSGALSGLLTVPNAFAAHRDDSPDHVRNLYSFVPATLLGYAAGAVIIAALYYEHAPRALLAGWLVVFALMWFARLWLSLRFRQVHRQPGVDFPQWKRYWKVAAMVAAVIWGAVPVLFYGYGGTLQKVGLILIVYSYCVAAVPVFADQRGLFYAYLGLIFIPLIASIAGSGTPDAIPVAGTTLLIMAITAALAQNFRRALLHMIELKQERERLAEQLTIEKAAADEARAVAEAASRAKTQFFSAASHDLRQPLHAMVLFAEALRQKNRDTEVAQLINSINASVDALEGLFSELLDMTKIDSGAIEVNTADFSLDDLFGRLKLHFEPTAFEKGLSLTLRTSRRFGRADPVLVERIARNLISNAIRYTEDGGVLLAVRPRGDKLLLQVWDSGIGITPEALPRIFDEFYQVHGTRQIDPHHRKGLGLGLAIVKRLADLMGTPLTVRSQPGRGTVFTLELPRGQAPRQSETVPSLRGSIPLTLQGRRIVIVEDEPAVRDGLEVLLRAWGAEVIGFDAVEPTLHWAATEAARAAPPALVIADYRLPENKTGVEVIRGLRAAFGAALPAIVVTGSTMSDHENEAQTDDFHMMFKPVVPTKLRAMIAFKLGLRARS